MNASTNLKYIATDMVERAPYKLSELKTIKNSSTTLFIDCENTKNLILFGTNYQIIFLSYL